MVVVLIALKPAPARHIRGCGPPNVFLLPSFIRLQWLQSPEWAATRFLIQFGFMFSCFLTSSGRGNNIYATAGWSLYKATILMMERSQDKCPHPRHRETKIQYSDAGVILNIWEMWRCDVYLASYSRHVLDVWSDHFRHIVCIARAALGTHLQYTQRKPPTESFISISQYSRSWVRVRGAIFIMTKSLLAGICWHNLILWRVHALCMNSQSWPNTRARAGAEEGFCNKYFCADKKKIDQRFRF